MSERHWTHAGHLMPWLRGQGVHFARADLEDLVATTFVSGGYALALASSANVLPDARFDAIAAALHLPASCGNNLDAFADSLVDLPLHRPDVGKLALLWSDADQLMNLDLLAFHQLCVVLGDTTDGLWADEQFVFETVVFVPPPFGADAP